MGANKRHAMSAKLESLSHDGPLKVVAMPIEEPS